MYQTGLPYKVDLEMILQLDSLSSCVTLSAVAIFFFHIRATGHFPVQISLGVKINVLDQGQINPSGTLTPLSPTH